MPESNLFSLQSNFQYLKVILETERTSFLCVCKMKPKAVQIVSKNWGNEWIFGIHTAMSMGTMARTLQGHYCASMNNKLNSLGRTQLVHFDTKCVSKFMHVFVCVCHSPRILMLSASEQKSMQAGSKVGWKIKNGSTRHRASCHVRAEGRLISLQASLELCDAESDSKHLTLRHISSAK